MKSVMQTLSHSLSSLSEPKDYYKGAGECGALPAPLNVLLFARHSKRTLQQEALQNRSHHRFVFLYNVETSGHVHVDHFQHVIHPGQALLIFPYQFHHFAQLISPKISWLFCTFELQDSTLLHALKNRVVDVSPASIEALNHLLDRWVEGCETEAKSDVQEQQLQLSALQVLLSLKNNLQATAMDLPPQPTENIIQNINRLMSEWRGRTVRGRDFAQELGLSESRLRVLFKEAAGIPLGSYLQNYRINRAMSLLRTTRLPIAEICEDTGFSSPQAFSRTFKQEVGQSPRSYRSA